MCEAVRGAPGQYLSLACYGKHLGQNRDPREQQDGGELAQYHDDSVKPARGCPCAAADMSIQETGRGCKPYELPVEQANSIAESEADFGRWWAEPKFGGRWQIPFGCIVVGSCCCVVNGAISRHQRRRAYQTAFSSKPAVEPKPKPRGSARCRARRKFSIINEYTLSGMRKLWWRGKKRVVYGVAFRVRKVGEGAGARCSQLNAPSLRYPSCMWRC